MPSKRSATVAPVHRKLQDLYAGTSENFERFTEQLFQKKGFQTERVGKRGDMGVDIRLHDREGMFIVQGKRYRSWVGPQVVRDFYGTMLHEGAWRGFLVTTGAFTAGAVLGAGQEHRND